MDPLRRDPCPRCYVGEQFPMAATLVSALKVEEARQRPAQEPQKRWPRCFDGEQSPTAATLGPLARQPAAEGLQEQLAREVKRR